LMGSPLEQLTTMVQSARAEAAKSIADSVTAPSSARFTARKVPRDASRSPLFETHRARQAPLGCDHLHAAQLELRAGLRRLARGKEALAVEVVELERGSETELKSAVHLLLRLGSQRRLRLGLLERDLRGVEVRLGREPVRLGPRALALELVPRAVELGLV